MRQRRRDLERGGSPAGTADVRRGGTAPRCSASEQAPLRRGGLADDHIIRLLVATLEDEELFGHIVDVQDGLIFDGAEP